METKLRVISLNGIKVRERLEFEARVKISSVIKKPIKKVVYYDGWYSEARAVFEFEATDDEFNLIREKLLTWYGDHKKREGFILEFVIG